jgi:catechol 2,3-dioxygenase-like lactoylglutathione lyase family enzyme
MDLNRTVRMKRFHIALAVHDLDASIADYSERLGQRPNAIVQGKYAMWRTALLNFSINQNPERAGQLRHIGFEDDGAEGFTSTSDVNGIEWEHFSAAAQDERIVAMYGVPVSA